MRRALGKRRTWAVSKKRIAAALTPGLTDVSFVVSGNVGEASSWSARPVYFFTQGDAICIQLQSSLPEFLGFFALTKFVIDIA